MAYTIKYPSRIPGVLEIESDYDNRLVKVGNYTYNKYVYVDTDTINKILKGNGRETWAGTYKELEKTIKKEFEVLGFRSLTEDFYPKTELATDYSLIETKYYNQFVHKHFGSKFLKRLQAALNDVFLYSYVPREMWQYFKGHGKNWKRPINLHVVDTPEYKMVIKDKLYNISPFVFDFNMNPQDLKEFFGKALWKHICGNSIYRNKYLSMYLTRFKQFKFYGGQKSVHRLTNEIKKLSVAKMFAFAPMGTYKTLNATNLYVQSKSSKDISYVLQIYADTLRMEDQLFGNNDNRLHFKSYDELRNYHDKLSQKINERKYSDEPFAEPLEFTIEGYTFKRLISPLEIAQEGSTMKHCVGSYVHQTLNRQYDVFSIVGPERATLGVTRASFYQDPKKNQFGGWRFNQCYGKCNSKVSEKLQKICQEDIIKLLNKKDTEETKKEAA